MNEAPSEMNAFDVEGVGRVFQCGKPEYPLVILLHGFMQTGRSWGSVATLLSRRCVLAPDLLGHGASMWKTADQLTLEDYVEQVNTLVEWAKNSLSTGNSSTVDLVGYSMGGRIAALYATRYPEKVGTLILESAGLGPQNDEERAARAEKAARMIAELDRSIALDPDHPLSAFIDWWEHLALFESQSDLPKSVRTRMRTERLANDADALRMCLKNAGAHRMDDLRSRLVGLDKPLLYIVGERDVAYTKVARSLMRAWADQDRDLHPSDSGFVQIDVVAQCGHNVHAESPEQYTSLVEGFLARCD